MRLRTPFVRLPLRCDPAALVREVATLPNSAWVPHPTGYAGNDAALLVSPGGRIDQGFIGAMAPTPHLETLPFIRQIMATLGCTWGRSRLMRLAPGARVQPHIDTHYYWRTHWRMHIPVVTNPGVRFFCGGDDVHMAPGECWLFDSFRPHEVRNEGSESRVHLVLDTVGGGRLFDLLRQAQAGAGDEDEWLQPVDGEHRPLIEQRNTPRVMSPWEIRCHVAELLSAGASGAALEPVRERLERFIDAWTAAWARFGEQEEGFATYLKLVIAARDDLGRLGADEVRVDNGLSLLVCLREIVFRMAVPRPEQTTFPAMGEPRRIAR